MKEHWQIEVFLKHLENEKIELKHRGFYDSNPLMFESLKEFENYIKNKFWFSKYDLEGNIIGELIIEITKLYDNEIYSFSNLKGREKWFNWIF